MSKQTSYRYPDLPPELKGGFNLRMLGFFGAGAIIASVTIGSGETLFASRGGAIFGYALLWCFVGGAIMKGVQVYTGARHLTLTGEHPMTHWGSLPGPRNWVPIVIGVLSLLCFPFWLAGLPVMLGKIINWIFDLGVGNDAQFLLLARTWATIAIIVAVALTWLQTYSILERAQTVIVGLLILLLCSQPGLGPGTHGSLRAHRPGIRALDQGNLSNNCQDPAVGRNRRIPRGDRGWNLRLHWIPGLLARKKVGSHR